MEELVTWLRNEGYKTVDGILKLGKKTMTMSMVDEALAKQRNYTLGQLLQQGGQELFDKAVASMCEGEDDREACDLYNWMPTRMKRMNPDLVQWFISHATYSRDSKGSVMFLKRYASAGNTWTIVNDLISAVTIKDKEARSNLTSFLPLYASMMQRPMRGFHYDMYDRDGNHVGTTDWPGIVQQAANAALEHGEKLPTKEAMARMMRQVDEDPSVDPRVIPSLETAIGNGLDGFMRHAWERERQLHVTLPTTITNNPETPSFCYVDMKSFKEGATPHFDGFMEAMHPAVRNEFMACLFSCVFAKCHHPLVVWLHGEGADGKSQLFAALNAYFGGNLVGSMSGKSIEGDFGMENLIGKRIIVWGDCQNGNALSSNVVHGITGGDVMSVNRKNQSMIDYKFESQLFIGSNDPPNINVNARNEARRILYCPMTEPSRETMSKYCETESDGSIKRHSNGMPVYKSFSLSDALVSEMQAIMWKCGQQFKVFCKPPYNQMSISKGAFDLMMEKCEVAEQTQFDEFINDNYVVTGIDCDHVRMTQLHGEYLDFIYGIGAAKKLKQYQYDLKSLRRHILVVYSGKVTEAKIRSNHERLRVYVGIKPKHGATDRAAYVYPETEDGL